jgi:two-component sensor histidine kinase
MENYVRTLTPEMFVTCAAPHWSGSETGGPAFADFRLGCAEAVSKRVAKLEQENARLIAKCEQQRLLMAELGHRVKNSLTLVQAMVTQTLREQISLDGCRDALTARIGALGQSHAILIDEGWSGASLKQVVEGALKLHGYRGPSERFQITGPSVRLGPQQMLALSMALHELGTNAAKYGALSVAAGRVEVTWTTTRSTNGRTLRLQWREAGGPLVAPPTRRGFGSKLIERALRDAMDGEVSLAFEPSGVVCTVLAHLAVTGRKAGANRPSISAPA